MKKLIEYRLWAGQIPYFVADPLGGVFSGGKCYGVSRDTERCYLPDTVVVLTAEELSEIVQGCDLLKQSKSDPMASEPMGAADKEGYLSAWLAKHGVQS